MLPLAPQRCTNVVFRSLFYHFVENYNQLTLKELESEIIHERSEIIEKGLQRFETIYNDVMFALYIQRVVHHVQQLLC